MPDKDPSPSLAYVPDHADHDDLVRTARECQACDLYKRATQTVFGEGPTPAPVFLIGEQPGDQEDRQGKPFVGPAGRVLDAALEEAEIPRDQVYVTNAVKHFKWEPRGKRRIHSKPNMVEIHACHGWLEAELRLARPQVIVCLGATAAQAFFGRQVSVREQRGEVLDGAPWAEHLVTTLHPSALLRLRNVDEAAYARARSELVEDLRRVAELVTFPRPRPLSGARARTARTSRTGR